MLSFVKIVRTASSLDGTTAINLARLLIRLAITVINLARNYEREGRLSYIKIM